MDKMKLAHDMALAMAADGNVPNENIVAIVWQYADAMQAEDDKRKPSGLPDALCEAVCMDIQGNWQPDWSQAPEWAVAWAFDKNGATWWSEVPEIHENIWDGRVQAFANAPSFGYTGNWKDSLRERPE